MHLAFLPRKVNLLAEQVVHSNFNLFKYNQNMRSEMKFVTTVTTGWCKVSQSEVSQRSERGQKEVRKGSERGQTEVRNSCRLGWS